MSKVTITTSQLHFEDLEPRRFEDLIRQLIYDFRNWKHIEGTGRSGSDEGYDARAWEQTIDQGEIKPDKNSTNLESGYFKDRVWLIQCKREKSLTPAKLKKYLQELNPNEVRNLHGIIFAVAADCSKKTRDAFRDFCVQEGLSEFYLWSKSEIEDMLFQPKNDHLLFAYFGISLQIKQKTTKSKLGNILAIKKKIYLSIAKGDEILIRDSEDTRYPYLEDKNGHRFERGRWLILKFKDLSHDGARFLISRHYAYINPNSAEWDYDEEHNQTRYNLHDDPWYENSALPFASGKNGPVWHQLEDTNKAWYEVFVTLPYENILAIDKLGDPFHKKSHIYTIPWPRNTENLIEPPFPSYTSYELASIAPYSQKYRAYPEKRIEIFKK